MKKIAVLLTCHNRKAKTLSCLRALHACSLPEDLNFDVYLVDDGSTDGTKEAVAEHFPAVHIIVADGSLFWAAGSNTAWKAAIASDTAYDYYLLLNDDTLIFPELFDVFEHDLAMLNNAEIILVGSTYSSAEDRSISYGGRKLLKPGAPKATLLTPNGVSPQAIDLGNANIMLVSHPVVEKIGVLTDAYKHGFADFEYTLTARKHNIPVMITSMVLGICENDHGKKWLSKGESTLKERIAFMYSVKGLSYDNYMKYYQRHFPKHVFREKVKMWLKTLFPWIWDLLKR
ncbi:glycosyltransferase family 2 protein [Pedobacter sp. SAFR-022]|uniref:glycosyltransferase family 2 protein n=1 Tax=Pedobacter sp. SAFR-022 TaxID=3436861 RepID=UPI003F80D3BE